jgi:CRP/FNR family transcriptional regulator, cyclic AMP receptor protein
MSACCERCTLDFDPTAFVADPQLLFVLEQRAVPVACERERILFRQGDIPAMLFILHEGEATLSMNSPCGERLFSAPVTGGSLLGLPGLVGNQPYTLSATAHAGAQVSSVARDDVMELMRSDPAISLHVLKVLAAEVRSARRAIS